MTGVAGCATTISAPWQGPTREPDSLQGQLLPFGFVRHRVCAHAGRGTRADPMAEQDASDMKGNGFCPWQGPTHEPDSV